MTVYNYQNTWNKKEIRKVVKRKFPDFKLNKIEIQPSTKCHFNCPWCFGKNLKPKVEEPIKPEIYRDNVFKPIRKYRPIVMIAGLYSEPLLYPWIEDIFKAVKGLKFGLYTNGLELKEDISRIILENSTPKSHISINISSALHFGRIDEIIRNIEVFAKLRKKINPKFQINAPILLNGTDFKDLQARLLKVGVDNIRYSLQLTPIYPVNVIKELKKLAPKNVFLNEKKYDKCYAMTNSLSISPTGYVYPCSQTTTSVLKGFEIGSVIDKKITDIWQSDEHKKFWKKFNPNCEVCRCNVVEHKFNEFCNSLR